MMVSSSFIVGPSISSILLVTTMFIPYRLLAVELKRSGCFKVYLDYQRSIGKLEVNSLRIKFLNNCRRSDLIPRFLKFRVPNNGCFDDRSVHEFQKTLLKKELVKARENQTVCIQRLDERRSILRNAVSYKLLPSIIVYTRRARLDVRSEQYRTHNKKLQSLSDEQERPLFSVENTVFLCNLEKTPPSYVLETLSLGPKNPILDRFNPKDVMVELDVLLRHCRFNRVSEDIITDINVKTLNYIKKCKKLKSSRNIEYTKRYLKENELLAVPFDKGIGFCLMKKEEYFRKLDEILSLAQFEKLTKTRKNEKNPVLKEEERIVSILKKLRDEGKIDISLYHKLKPRGSQPARLYGLAKVHKTTIPTRPVLSMPGSSYHKIGIQVAEWLKPVPECQINSSTKTIADRLKDIHLGEDEELVSFDVSSLYTNVPVLEAIEVCTNLLYDGERQPPPVDRETFKTLAQISSCNVIMSTHDGYYKQVNGLAMGSPPAPHLANGWMSKFDVEIGEGAKLYFRYMDDIIRDIKRDCIDGKLVQINGLHPSLSFTIEREKDGSIPFLDMKIVNANGHLASTWYNKPTDTGLIMNYHALAPKRYKRSVVSGFVHRIHRACSTWKYFHASIEKAKRVLEKNQYPPSFYNPIIEEALNQILQKEETTPGEKKNQPNDNEEGAPKRLYFIQYRGKCTDDYARALHRCNAPCTMVMTLRKLRTALPSLKPSIPTNLRSGIVYQVNCPRCDACYVGQTDRHWQTRFKEHLNKKQPVGHHLHECRAKIKCEDVKILASTSRGEAYLLTLEALWIKEVRPQINTKDEFKSRTLTLKW